MIEKMKESLKFLKIASQSFVIRKGILLSVLVGSVLNFVNQGNLLLGNQLPDISIVKICLTYLTPFLVSVYSTTSAVLDRNRITHE